VCEALRGQYLPARTLARQALRRHPGAHASLTWRTVEALAAGNTALHDALTASEPASTVPAVEGFTPEGLRWLRAQLSETAVDCTHSPVPTNR
jgi:hypothetical protein